MSTVEVSYHQNLSSTLDLHYPLRDHQFFLQISPLTWSHPYCYQISSYHHLNQICCKQLIYSHNWLLSAKQKKAKYKHTHKASISSNRIISHITHPMTRVPWFLYTALPLNHFNKQLQYTKIIAKKRKNNGYVNAR